ncbi:MAG: DUF294 nucleotidyltransferase-like domain-containing protein [Hyphomicrobiaceae bacterium]|nr:DUF294 nucleotidyltransferase-like domain-containing protein [Hyphomicrobiaceae bacterium]
MADAGNELGLFLRSVEPLTELADSEIDRLVDGAEVVSVSACQTITELGQPVRHVHVVKSGIVEIRSATGKVFARLRPGQTFGVRAAFGTGRASYRAVATEPCEVVALPKADLAALDSSHPGLPLRFVPVGREGFEPVQAAVPPPDLHGAGLDMMTTTARDLMTAGPITIAPGASVRDGACLMRTHDISCLPIVADGKLVGIVTDGDLRDRVIAEGRSSDVTMADVMTADPVRLEPDALAFDALVLMMTRGFSHLPLVEAGRLVGIITHTNLVRAQSRSAIYMIGQIHRQDSAEGMAKIVAGLPDLLVALVQSGACAHKTGRIITSITDACTARLLTLAEARLGLPPVPYLWAACGSQGRQEQTGYSDQDNCLILADTYDAARDARYFEEMARFVCDGLNACGYVYCPGDMMATNPKWCQPVAVWRSYFRSWVERPEPAAQMLASVMFDLRPIWGEASLFEDMQAEALQRAKSNALFIAHMLSNALTHKPPIGLFGTLSVPWSGDHRNKIDLKMSGTAPIVDLARLYALTAGIAEVNTHRRLERGWAASVLDEAGARDLLAAFEFIAMTRLRHQADLVRAGKKPDNFMPTDEISHLELNQLKDAFAAVKTVQQAMGNVNLVQGR